MDNQTERTVYFKDLVFSVLYKWKAIVAAMLIGAALLGGMEYLGAAGEVTLNSVSVTPENQMKIDQYQSTLERTERLIESHSVYLKESVIVALDSYAAYTSTTYISVTPASQESVNDPTSAILFAYRTEILSNTVMEALGEQLKVAPIYVKELITPEVTGTGVLNVFARGRTLEEAEAIAAYVKTLAEDRQERISRTIAPHSLQTSSVSAGPAVDKALYDLQNAAYQRMTSLKNTVTNTTTELNKLLPTQLQEGEPQPLLFAIVGAILGAFLMVAIACVQHIGSGKVYSARTLKDRTGLRILGRVCGKKRNPIDRWLRKLEGRVAHTQPDAIIANIVNRCAEVKQLLVFGETDAELLRPLTEKLNEAGVNCTLIAEPAGSAQAMKALPACDAAVLVEVCGRSAYEDVLLTVETVTDYGKTLLGCVLIDG